MKNKKSMKKSKKRKNQFWRITFALLLILCIVDWSIPDPVVLVDEIILTAGVIFSAFKIN